MNLIANICSVDPDQRALIGTHDLVPQYLHKTDESLSFQMFEKYKLTL